MYNDLFQYHRLNKFGEEKVKSITDLFTELLDRLAIRCPVQTREFSIVKTKLEEACFFAKKSVATQRENQE